MNYYRIIKRFLFVILLFGLQSCNISSVYYKKNEPSFLNNFDIKFYETEPINKKEFKEKSKILKLKYGATDIRIIRFIESKKNYYCEFYTYRDTIKCLLLDENMNIVSEKTIQFDY